MFDDIGDPLSGYDIVAWDWSGPRWAFTVIGSFMWPSVHLDIDKTKIQWPGEDNQVTGLCPLGRWGERTPQWPQ